MVSAAISIPLTQETENSRRQSLLRAFYAGPENFLAQQAFESFTSNCERFNPLVIHGPAGTGKSQLARCIATRWQTDNPDSRMLSMSSAEFARHYNEAIRNDVLSDFRGPFQQIGMFVLEDIETFATKPSTQKELLFLFDRMWRSHVSILVTLRAAPATISGILPALASRLAMGFCLPIAKPGFLARQAMLQDVLGQFPKLMSPKAVDAIAQESHLTAVEMLAAARSLMATGQPIDLETVRRELGVRTEAAEVSHARITRATASYFQITQRSLKSASRNRQVVTARGVAIYLMRQLTSESLEAIGKHVGNRDHTTVLHNVRKMERLAQTEPEIQDAISTIQLQLT